MSAKITIFAKSLLKKMKNIVHLPIIDSTNLEMSRRILSNKLFFNSLEEPYMLYADYQSGGRGQGKNVWESEQGPNILATIYFRPYIIASQQFVFNQYFALTTRDFLLQYVPDVQIKWPNDLYVQNKKLAGILIEHTLSGERLEYSIAGIGMNVNQTHFSDDLPNPVSLAQITGHHYRIQEMAEHYFDCLKESYLLLKNGFFVKDLQKEYLSCLYQYERYCPYIIRGEQVSAKIVGTDPFGRLQLVRGDGKQEICGLKEIIYL